MNTWRYVVDTGVSAAFGLAADEFLLASVAQSGTPTLRLYTYRPHVALVGRFQNIEAELNLEECRRFGAEINRRPTGGGAIVMGDGQLGLALVLPPDPDHGGATPAALFPRYAAPIIDGLRSLGVNAAFRPKNDIEVEGRKIAGLGVYLDDDGTILFHASILVDLDVRLMLRLLNLTPEKISDKAVATFEERLTTINREAGRPVSVDEVRQAIGPAFERGSGIRLEARPFTSEELDAIREIETSRYGDPDWIFLRTPPLDTTGSSIRKTEAGLLRVYVSLAGSVIKSVLITGDFFGDGRTLRDLEARLKWSQGSVETIAGCVEAAWSDPALSPVWSLQPALLTDAIVAAIDNARQQTAAGRAATSV
jgi:lipoate-protein ligase A